jgi:uncharacterized protein (AIM24 family)
LEYFSRGEITMADIIEYTIFGDDLQMVEIQLDPEEGIRAEAGTMIYMDKGIDMQTGTGGGCSRVFSVCLPVKVFSSPPS